MTPDVGYKILFYSLLQTENTRGGYFLKKANELEIDPFNFFIDLKGLYDEMNKRVNTKIHDIWAADEDGNNREDLYYTINPFHLTNDINLSWIITKENIHNFLPGLEQFGQIIMNDLKREQSDKNRELIELLNTDTESKKDTSTAKLTGFQSSLTDKQIENLKNNLNKWILPDYQTKFSAIEHELFDRKYIDNFHKWQKHKTELANFLCVILNYKYFRPFVKGKKIQDFHKRQFISERYGYGKTGLSETWKKTKPKFDLVKIPFPWVEKQN